MKFHAALLLPPVPSPYSYSNLKAAYNAPLSDVLRRVTGDESRQNSQRILDIAVSCPQLRMSGPRCLSYAETQGIFASLYKLITVIATTHGVDIESDSGIDIRFVLLNASSADSKAGSDFTGPVIPITTFARSRRPWQILYSVQTEHGESLLSQFRRARIQCPDIQHVQGGLTISSQSPSTSKSAAALPDEHHFGIAVGGTFDHLHIGHKLLLTMFVYILDSPLADIGSNSQMKSSLTVGITAGALLANKKYAEFLQSWELRQRKTWEFLSSVLDWAPEGGKEVEIRQIDEQGPDGHAVHYCLASGTVVKLVEIWDPFGPTITDESIDALVLSAETRSGGKAVNQKRKDKGWPLLDLFEVDVLDAEEHMDQGAAELDSLKHDEFANKLSSTSIRKAQSEEVTRKNGKI